MTKEEIISKIIKLLKLVSSPNEHEAAAAATMAQKMILQYNIEEELLTGGKVKDKWVEDSLTFGGRPTIFKFLYEIIGDMTLVKTFTRAFPSYYRGPRRTDVVFFGRESNVKIAVHSYQFLERTFKDLWTKYRIENKTSITFRQSYFDGLATGIRQKLHEGREKIKKESAVNCVALVKVSNEAKIEAKKRYSLTSRSSVSFYHNGIVNNAGIVDGKKINLVPAISGSSRQRSQIE